MSDSIVAHLPMRQTASGTYQYEIAPGRWISRQRIDQIASPMRHEARQIAHAAIDAGILKRQPCEICQAVPAEAHHDDYSKPLAVRWLCATHHRQEHIAANRDKPKQPRAHRKLAPDEPVEPVEPDPRKNPAAVALGKLGGSRNTEAQRLARAQNGAKATGRRPRYRLVPEGLEHREDNQWRLLSPPLDRAALAYLRRHRT